MTSQPDGLRVLYASMRAYPPDRVDGALNAAHALLSMLRERGHAVEAVAAIGKHHPGRVRGYRLARLLSGRRLLAWPDRRNGYVTRRAWGTLVLDVVAARIRRFRPHVLLTQLDGCEAIARLGIAHGIPTVVWIHDNEFSFFNGDVPRSPRLLTLASSEFVSQQVAHRLGYHSTVLYPPIRLDRCVAARDAAAEAITIVNPVKEKGVDVALAVARRLPHRQFLFVESWPLRGERLQRLLDSLAATPNVTFRRVSDDMRPVYGATRLLLAPSQWVEAFCMVVVEANANGIPAVVSRIGGLPTTLGPGGVLVDPDAPADVWAAAVEDVLSSPARYDQLAAQARCNAARDEFNADRIVDRFVALATSHVDRREVDASPHDDSVRAGLSRR